MIPPGWPTDRGGVDAEDQSSFMHGMEDRTTLHRYLRLIMQSNGDGKDAGEMRA